MSLDAIEALPGSFAGALGRDKLDEMRAKRLQTEHPDIARSIADREAMATDLERVYRVADATIARHERRMPATDADTGRAGRDGLWVVDLEVA